MWCHPLPYWDCCCCWFSNYHNTWWSLSAVSLEGNVSVHIAAKYSWKQQLSLPNAGSVHKLSTSNTFQVSQYKYVCKCLCQYWVVFEPLKKSINLAVSRLWWERICSWYDGMVFGGQKGGNYALPENKKGSIFNLAQSSTQHRSFQPTLSF